MITNILDDIIRKKDVRYKKILDVDVGAALLA